MKNKQIIRSILALRFCYHGGQNTFRLNYSPTIYSRIKYLSYIIFFRVQYYLYLNIFGFLFGHPQKQMCKVFERAS